MSTPAMTFEARIATLRGRLADLGLSPDEDEIQALAAMDAMFHAALLALRTRSAGVSPATREDIFDA